MIYFENYLHSRVGLNNQLMSYTLCLSLSNFLDRDFFFDHEYPSNTPPAFAVEGEMKDKFEILMTSPRSLVTGLLDMPARRALEADRDIANKYRIDNLQFGFMTTRAMQAKYGSSVLWTQFRLGRAALVKEDFDQFDLIEIGDINLTNVSFFYFLGKADKKSLLESVKIKYKADIEKFAAEISANIGPFNAMHIRMGDFFSAFGSDGYTIEVDRLRRYLDANLSDRALPLLVATDGLAEKDLFARLLADYKYIFIDELVFGEYEKAFGELEFTDFNVLSIINQLLCAAGADFTGTYRSTFTGIIHRLRQERYGKTDFNFAPDDLIAKLLTPDFKIKTDRQGFFDWNRYSIAVDHPEVQSWAREWDFDFTSPAF